MATRRRTRHRIAIGLLVCPIAASMAGIAASDALAYAHRQYHRMLLIEGAGLFWILAELAILFVCVCARQRLASRPPFLDFALRPAEIRRATQWLALFVLGAVAVMGRHWIWPPVYTVLSEPDDSVPPLAAIREMWLARTYAHSATWSLFVLLWVTLEIAIVIEGRRAYVLLRDRIENREILTVQEDHV